MKDSGVEWLGKIPTHWDVVRGNAVLDECRTKNDPLVSENYLSLMANVGVIPYEEKGDVGNKKPEDLRKCKLVRRGDFVINSMNYAIGSYGVSKYGGVCSPVYVVVKHRAGVVDARFMDLILSSPSYQNYAQSFGTGILDHRRAIGWDEIKAIRVPLPPLGEQAQIAEWTIRSRDRIDALVAKKTHFIELLHEKRQALVTHAVTKGLNPNGPMKETGVEWLGKVPTHWAVVPPTALFTESKERAHGDDQMLSATQKYGVIPLAEFEALEKRQVTKANVNLDMRKHVEVGDFVISMRSMDGGLERSRAVGSVRSSYTVLKVGPRVEGRYFGYLLKCSLYIQALRLTSNFIRDGQDLSFTHVRQIKLPLPSLREQAEIANYIESANSRIDTLIDKTERSIELLREHRTALITAAVTGKLDLRDAA